MIFLHIVDFNDDQQVEGPNCTFNEASKGFTRSQPNKKGSYLVKRSRTSRTHTLHNHVRKVEINKVNGQKKSNSLYEKRYNNGGGRFEVGGETEKKNTDEELSTCDFSNVIT